MTVTEISKEINLNRNSVAKYLEVLLISGHVEMKSYGPAKVFFLSQRVPMSALIDFSSDYIIILDRDLRTVQVNDNFLKLVNLERKNLIGKKLANTSFRAFNTPEMTSILKNVLNGKRVTKELEFPLGKILCSFNLKAIPITFEDGLPGVTMILEDITERKRIEQELIQLSDAVKASTDSIVITDSNGKIVNLNEATLQMYGAKNKDDLIGKNALDILVPNDRERVTVVLEEFTKKGSSNIQEFSFVARDGTKKRIQVSLGAIKDSDDNPKGFVAISRDVSGYKK
jgi:PAS domain S-box-containing protein